MSETVKKENDMTETVKFNVGGSIYEVSRSLLERYPDTMLAKPLWRFSEISSVIAQSLSVNLSLNDEECYVHS